MASVPNTHLLTTQVGGHPGIVETEDGSSIGKPALPLEHKFYEAIYSDDPKNQDFKLLQPFIPKLMGTLRLVGRLDETQSDGETLWLENVTYPFLKPNQMDIKLGTVLYDTVDSVPEQKRLRMIETAKQTTSKDTGIRITAFQVYKSTTPEVAVAFTKAEGKSLKAADLPDIFTRFFPVSGAADAPTECGLPRSTLLHILRGIQAEITKIRDVYGTIEMRMVGASFLIVYEADWARAEEGVERLEKEKAGLSGQTDDEEYEGEDDENNEDEDDDDDDEEEKCAVPFVVKLIDFAHTHITRGDGPDASVLQGMNKVLELIEGRINRLEKD